MDAWLIVNIIVWTLVVVATIVLRRFNRKMEGELAELERQVLDEIIQTAYLRGRIDAAKGVDSELGRKTFIMEFRDRHPSARCGQ